jgi:Nucleotidyltransferase domain
LAIDWEQTFRTWSKPSSDHEAEKQANAERMVGDAIRNYASFKARPPKIIVQGSYRNNTNVRQESDVDICICYMTPFFADYTFADYTNEDVGNVNATYSFWQFKNDLHAALMARFGVSGIRRGDKAFDVHSNTYRVDADVIPAFAYRLYLKQQLNPLGQFVRPYVQPEGTKIITDSNKVIINWPEQHYTNGVEKNRNTGGKFKSVVRAVKRLKFYLIEKQVGAANSVCSYLIECLLYNVADSVYIGDSYADIVQNALLACFSATQTDETSSAWLEVNRMKYLFHPTQPWTRQQAYNFVLAAWAYVKNN